MAAGYYIAAEIYHVLRVDQQLCERYRRSNSMEVGLTALDRE
jgi:hypothetical protein